MNYTGLIVDALRRAFRCVFIAVFVVLVSFSSRLQAASNIILILISAINSDRRRIVDRIFVLIGQCFI